MSNSPESNAAYNAFLEEALKDSKLNVTPEIWKELVIQAAGADFDFEGLGMEDPRMVKRRADPHYKLPIPENQRYCFQGVGLGIQPYEIKLLEDGKVIFDCARKGNFRAVVRETLGHWATSMEDDEDRLKLVLPSDFDFLVRPDRGINAKTFDVKSRFGPFIIGVIASRFHARDYEIYMSNAPLQQKIHRTFENLFQFSLGTYSLRPRVSGGDRVSIYMGQENFAKVMMTLMSVDAVGGKKRGLPFLNALLRLGQEDLKEETEEEIEPDKPVDPMDLKWAEAMRAVTQERRNLSWPTNL